MRGKVHILVYCPIDTLQWGSTHSALKSQQLAECVTIDVIGTFKPKGCMLLRFCSIISHSIKNRLSRHPSIFTGHIALP